jgi:hypothetical protein
MSSSTGEEGAACTAFLTADSMSSWSSLVERVVIKDAFIIKKLMNANQY